MQQIETKSNNRGGKCPHGCLCILKSSMPEVFAKNASENSKENYFVNNSTISKSIFKKESEL